MTDLAQPPRWKVVTAFAAVYLIWGSTYLAIAFAIRSVPPFFMTGSRFLLAGLILYAWARLHGAARPVRANWRAAAILGALFFLVGNGALTWAENRGMPSGLAAVLVAMVGAWTVLVEWLKPGGRRPTTGVLAGIVLGLIGVALLLLPGRRNAQHVDPLLAGVLMLSSFLWAVGAVYSKGAALPRSSLLAAGMQMACGGAGLLLLSALSGDMGRFEPAAVTPRSAVAFVYLLTFGSLIGFTAFAWLLQVVSPAKVSTYGYVNPMVAVLLGWILAGERLTAGEIAASLVIVSAVIVIVTSKGLAARATASPRAEATPVPTEAEVA